MPYAPQAFFDADVGIKNARKFCSPGTRVNILAEIEAWASPPNPFNPFKASAYWISGMAGTGKSTIAMSVCQKLKEKGVLAGSFFCSRQIPECRDYRFIIPTLSCQLAKFSRAFADALNTALLQELHLDAKKPVEQVKYLLIEPWKKVSDILKREQCIPVFVLDALDECQGISSVLEPLVNAIQDSQLKGLKFLFTSRPEQKINKEMQSTVPNLKPFSRVKEFILHQVEESFVQADIKTYIEQELNHLEPTKQQVESLANLSGKLFIYAATVISFVKGDEVPITRQKKRLEVSLSQGDKSGDLEALYTTIVESAIFREYSQGNEIAEDLGIIHTIISLGRPLSCNAIAQLMNLEVDIVQGLIGKLQAVFYISEKSHAVYTFHASFPDFIMKYQVLYNANLYHYKLSFSCFQKLEKLQFNMCNLPSSFTKDEEVVRIKEHVAEVIGEALQYSCQFWGFHCIQCEWNENIIHKLYSFVIERGIFWIEAMSLLTQLQDNVQGMTPHLYISILPLWENKFSLKPKVKNSISIQNRSLVAQIAKINVIPTESQINCVAFSPHGTRIVSSSNETLRIWDATTGAQLGHSLQGHKDSVRSVAFSPDGTRIVSGSDDKTVRIWDATTGAQLGDSLQGHEDLVTSVAFSPDGTRIVSGSGDKTVRIWDATTGAELGHSLQGHEKWVRSVAFSPDGTRIVSGSDDKTVRIWDATTGAELGHSLQGHEKWVRSVAFSPDGTRIVSGSDDKTVRIWDATTGAQLGDSLQGHEDLVTSVAFSPDGTRIVSGSNDKTVRIWDATTGAQLGHSLQGHEDWVRSVAFSPDGTRIVSGSDDKIVRIWDATTGAQLGESLQGHEDWVTSVAFSPDGTRIVSGSIDKTVRIWDATTGAQLGDSLQGHEDWVTSVAFSPGGTRIVSGSNDKTVRIWDATTGAQLGDSLQGHEFWVKSVAFSPDGTRIVSGSHDKTVRIWDATTDAQLGDSLQGHEDSVRSVAFSPDGTRIVSGSDDETVRIWDATTGAQLGDSLQGHEDLVTSGSFSPDRTRIVSGSDDKTVRIWDATAGSQLGDSIQSHADWVLSQDFPFNKAKTTTPLAQNPQIWNCNSSTQQGSSFHSSKCMTHSNNNTKWTLKDDGWIEFTDNLNPIVWVPPQFRHFLWTPLTMCIISRNGYTQFSFRNCVYGDNWTTCIHD
ncbi:hypothetical protein GYMLUDRAFT_218382 [Collybiopsis luxurians FD-317 M1]|nr:hypothetical protein GYMLUDRAFT_218382 [Collybiopsis luxurians FD-317 M1]